MPPAALQPSSCTDANPCGAAIFRLEDYRRRRLKPRRAAKLIGLGALGLCAVIGSLADSAFAGTAPFFASGVAVSDSGNIHTMIMALIWATVANIAGCAAVLLMLSWLARPSATVVRLERRKKL
jgi:hypothetical protein